MAVSRTHGTIGGSITQQQLDGCRSSDFDLATAYPALPLPQELADVFMECTGSVLTAHPQVLDSHGERFASEQALGALVADLLGFSFELPTQVRATVTGSVAIDRAIRAVEMVAGERPSRSLCVITTDPSVDIAREMLAERSDITVVTVETAHASRLTDLDRIVSAIRASAGRARSTTVAVLLTSPENPTGRVWSSRELSAIACELGRIGGVLVVDHCFLLAGVQAPSVPSGVWSLRDGLCEWVGIWDTGKTIDLRGDKLAFIVTSGSRISAAVERSLAVQQFAPSQRAVAVFLRLLGHPAFRRYVADLGAACRTNLALLRAELPVGLFVDIPTAGTVAWVDLSRSGLADDTWRTTWIDQGVATVSGHLFFARALRPRSHLRVALARTEDYFATALSRVCALKAA